MQTVKTQVEHPTFETVWAALQEVAERQKETAEQMKETDRKLDKLGEQMGGLHNSFGEMAEHMVAPGIARRFNEMGFHFEEPAEPNYKIYDEKRRVRAEIDLLLMNQGYLLAVEVKAKLGEKDIEKHRKRLEILREDADRIADNRKILGGMAVAIMGKGDKEAILNAGLYPLEQSGDTMKLDLPQGFVPRVW